MGLQQTIALLMREYERGRREGQVTLAFQGSDGGGVLLAARWQILNADEKVLVLRQSRLTAVASGPAYEATVIAMGRTLEALSRDIAAALLTLAPPAPRREYGAHAPRRVGACYRPLGDRWPGE